MMARLPISRRMSAVQPWSDKGASQARGLQIQYMWGIYTPGELCDEGYEAS